MDQKPIIIDSDDDDEDQQPPQRQAPAPAQVSPAKVDQLDDDEDEEQHARRFDETNILGLNSFPVFFAGNQLTPQKFGSKTLEGASLGGCSSEKGLVLMTLRSFCRFVR